MNRVIEDLGKHPDLVAHVTEFTAQVRCVSLCATFSERALATDNGDLHPSSGCFC